MRIACVSFQQSSRVIFIEERDCEGCFSVPRLDLTFDLLFHYCSNVHHWRSKDECCAREMRSLRKDSIRPRKEVRVYSWRVFVSARITSRYCTYCSVYVCSLPGFELLSPFRTVDTLPFHRTCFRCETCSGLLKEDFGAV